MVAMSSSIPSSVTILCFAAAAAFWHPLQREVLVLCMLHKLLLESAKGWSQVRLLRHWDPAVWTQCEDRILQVHYSCSTHSLQAWSYACNLDVASRCWIYACLCAWYCNGMYQWDSLALFPQVFYLLSRLSWEVSTCFCFLKLISTLASGSSLHVSSTLAIYHVHNAWFARLMFLCLEPSTISGGERHTSKKIMPPRE